MNRMKFALCSLSFPLIFLAIQGSNGSNLVQETCKDASEHDTNIGYDFCVACLGASSKSESKTVEDLLETSIQMTRSNATNIVSKISNLLKDEKLSQYAKNCLQDCSDLYSDSISELDEAVDAFKSKDFGTARTKLSASLDTSGTCEDQFHDKEGEESPLTEDNKIYTELNAMCLWLSSRCLDNSL